MKDLNDEIVDNIINMIANIDRNFVNMVVKRIESIGYTLIDGDEWMLSFSTQKIDNKIKRSCNITSIPNEMYQVACDMVCGDFLYVKKQIGKLKGFDFEVFAKSISIGDTKIDLSGQTSEQHFDSLLNYMIKGECNLSCYRKISW